MAEDALGGEGSDVALVWVQATAMVNAAFAKLPSATLKSLLKPENKDKLVKLAISELTPK